MWSRIATVKDARRYKEPIRGHWIPTLLVEHQRGKKECVMHSMRTFPSYHLRYFHLSILECRVLYSEGDAGGITQKYCLSSNKNLETKSS